MVKIKHLFPAFLPNGIEPKGTPAVISSDLKPIDFGSKHFLQFSVNQQFSVKCCVVHLTAANSVTASTNTSSNSYKPHKQEKKEY